MKARIRWVIALALLVPSACGRESAPPPERTIGLSSSLPLIWRESGDIRGELATGGAPHWAMRVLSKRGKVVALDSLSQVERRLPSQSDGLLVLVQPHPLTPEENVALDLWVRSGGRLLLFADPMLTAHSELPLGDPRAPQPIAMLSPILLHWGLELQFDAEQPAGERLAKVFDVNVPINLAGRFATADAGCRLSTAGIAVECMIGQGRALAIADAALFDGDETGRAVALDLLLDRIAR